jgi:hypothetical protein
MKFDKPADSSLCDAVIGLPGGDKDHGFRGNKAPVLHRAVLPDTMGWIQENSGEGKILFATLPLELRNNLRAAGDVYLYRIFGDDAGQKHDADRRDHAVIVDLQQERHITLR